MTRAKLPTGGLTPDDGLRQIGSGRLAQSIRLEEEGPHESLYLAILAITVMIGVFVAWAAIAEVSEVSSSSGEVLPIGSVQRVQHLEGGIILELYVQENDLVEKGQALLRLDGSAVLPELEKLRGRRVGLELRTRRLRAQLDRTLLTIEPPQPRYADLAANQNEILRTQHESLESKLQILRNQITQREIEKRFLRAQVQRVNEQIGFLAEVVEARRELAERGRAPRLQLLDDQRALAAMYSDLAELEGQRQRADEAISEAKGRVEELVAQHRLDAILELGRVTAEAAELDEAIRRLEAQVARLAIRAPVTGIVKGLQTETIGGVIAPGSTVLEVIPIRSELIVAARVSTRDIGHIRVGMPVNVKVLTYDYTTHGGIDGTVESISPTTFEEEDTGPYYVTRIKLSRNYVGDDPTRNLVVSGMTVIADIRIGQKTVLDYLLSPLYRTINESFRER